MAKIIFICTVDFFSHSRFEYSTYFCNIIDASDTSRVVANVFEMIVSHLQSELLL